MTLKEKIFDILIGNKFTVPEIKKKIKEKHDLTISESDIRVYLKRLYDNSNIRKLARDGRFVMYTAIEKESQINSNLDTQILKKLLVKFVDLEVYLENTTEREDNRIEELIKECQLI